MIITQLRAGAITLAQLAALTAGRSGAPAACHGDVLAAAARWECVKETRKLRKAKKRNRYTARGSFKATGKTGANDVYFKGTVGGKRLAAGEYRLKVRATDAAGNRSKQRTETFRIKRRS